VISKRQDNVSHLMMSNARATNSLIACQLGSLGPLLTTQPVCTPTVGWKVMSVTALTRRGDVLRRLRYWLENGAARPSPAGVSLRPCSPPPGHRGR
jgi:hypothetical protein